MSHSALHTELRHAIGSHGAWKLKLKTAVTTGRATISATEAGCANCCQFGKWLEDHAPDLGDGVQHRVISRLHHEFHETAGRIIAAIEQNDTAAAARILDTEFTPQSEHLVKGLQKWSQEADKTAA